MTQKFDIGLNSKINEFANRFVITRTTENDQSVFEDFGNYIIASSFLEADLDNIKLVSTNSSQGIDGIIITINNHLVTALSDFNKFGEISPLKVKIGFVQSTTQESFREQKFNAFTDEVVKFLSGSSVIEPFSSIYSKLFDDEYIDRLEETPIVSLFFLSGRTSYIILDEKLEAERKKITDRTDIKDKCKLDQLAVYQIDEIKREFDKIKQFHSVQLELDRNLQLPSIEEGKLSLLATIKFQELKKLIMTSDENLKGKLFIENVRHFIGKTPVNLDIKKTLDSDNKQFFPFLNNGLSIICNEIKRHSTKADTFTLTFPRIINGCQTTNMLFEKYKEDPNSLTDVEVVAKIMATNDTDLKKLITYAANNQNSIDKDLQSLNEFHEAIELYFSGKEEKHFHLYFERLRGQHAQVIPPYSKINIETLARVYVSVFLKEPHKMKSHALARIKDMQDEKKIFNSKDTIEDYYYSAVLYYWFNYFLVNNVINLRSKTMDMHLLMAVDLLLNSKNIKFTNDKLAYLSDENNAKAAFVDTNGILNNKEYLFEKRGFYTNAKVQQIISDFKNEGNNVSAG